MIEIIFNNREKVMSKIKYYGKNDWLYMKNFRDSTNFIIDKTRLTQNYSANDILEMYNVSKYLSDSKDSQCIEKNKTIKRILGQYFATINMDSISIFFDSIDSEYKTVFWELVAHYKLYKRIQGSIIKDFVSKRTYLVGQLLKQEVLVRYYENEIVDLLINNEDSAELFLREYEVEKRNNEDKYFFPKLLSPENIELIFLNYIKGEPNLNFLRLIIHHINSKDDFCISNKVKLLAKKKAMMDSEKIFSDNSGFRTELSVIFNEYQSEEKIENYSETKLECSYSTKWIRENLDYPTLLNNFIYLFDFVDEKMRCSFCALEKNIAITELLQLRSKREYKHGYGFDILQ
jgi:hypothetical protein